MLPTPQMEKHAECDHVKKGSEQKKKKKKSSEAESFKHMKINILHYTPEDGHVDRNM
jgi:hypothetical protein